MSVGLVAWTRLAAAAAVAGGAWLAASPAFAWGDRPYDGPPPGYGPRPPVMFRDGPPSPAPYGMRGRHHRPRGGLAPGFYGPRW